MSDAFAGALVRYGWNHRVRALFDDVGAADADPARVVRVERSHCVVACATGSDRRAQARVLPIVGDWVAVHEDIVCAVLPRSSTLSRQDPDGVSTQVLAANVDLVLVAAPADRLSIARVERELAVAWDGGAQPMVMMTKSDVAPAGTVDELRARLAGVEVISTSSNSGDGVEAVRAALRPCRTAVLLGPSGAGKSALANQLLGAQTLAIGAVRASDNRVRHTTTSRQLVCVPGGGVLIDTPGLRSLALAADGAGMDRSFDDIDDLAGGCRFADCRHDREPGCAVRAAAAAGTLDSARLSNFRKLEGELAVGVGRSDPQARRVGRSTWKARHKAIRTGGRRRRG